MKNSISRLTPFRASQFLHFSPLRYIFAHCSGLMILLLTNAHCRVDSMYMYVRRERSEWWINAIRWSVLVITRRVLYWSYCVTLFLVIVPFSRPQHTHLFNSLLFPQESKTSCWSYRSRNSSEADDAVLAQRRCSWRVLFLCNFIAE